VRDQWSLALAHPVERELIAVVLARGVGRRMQMAADVEVGLTPEQQAAADAGLKALMPMSDAASGGRPFLDYVLGALADAGFREVLLVVGPEHDRVRQYYEGPGAPERLSIDFAVQAEPRGTADAVRAAEARVAGRDFVVVNADNLYPVEALRALRGLSGPGLVAFERDALVASSGIPEERVAAFALVDVSPEGVLLDVIEKPSIDVMHAAGPTALVSMNCWRFDTEIFRACADISPSPRGEFEVTDAVRLAMARGVVWRVVPVRGPVLDLSRREDVPAVTARVARMCARP
jgi:glucose-1-phosphate thymidylyltransferase